MKLKEESNEWVKEEEKLRELESEFKVKKELERRGEEQDAINSLSDEILVKKTKLAYLKVSTEKKANQERKNINQAIITILKVKICKWNEFTALIGAELGFETLSIMDREVPSPNLLRKLYSEFLKTLFLKCFKSKESFAVINEGFKKIYQETADDLPQGKWLKSDPFMSGLYKIIKLDQCFNFSLKRSIESINESLVNHKPVELEVKQLHAQIFELKVGFLELNNDILKLSDPNEVNIKTNELLDKINQIDSKCTESMNEKFKDSMDYLMRMLKISFVLFYKKNAISKGALSQETRKIMSRINLESPAEVPHDESDMATLREELALRLHTEFDHLSRMIFLSGCKHQNPFNLIEEFEKVKKGFNPELMRFINASKFLSIHLKDLYSIISQNKEFFGKTQVQNVFRLHDEFLAFCKLMASEDYASTDMSELCSAYQDYCIKFLETYPKLKVKKSSEEFAPIDQIITLGKTITKHFLSFRQRSLKDKVISFRETIERSSDETTLSNSQNELTFLLDCFLKSTDQLTLIYQNTDFFTDFKVYSDYLDKISNVAKILMSQGNSDIVSTESLFFKHQGLFDEFIRAEEQKINKMKSCLERSYQSSLSRYSVNFLETANEIDSLIHKIIRNLDINERSNIKQKLLYEKNAWHDREKEHKTKYIEDQSKFFRNRLEFLTELEELMVVLWANCLNSKNEIFSLGNLKYWFMDYWKESLKTEIHPELVELFNNCFYSETIVSIHRSKMSSYPDLNVYAMDSSGVKIKIQDSESKIQNLERFLLKKIKEENEEDAEEPESIDVPYFLFDKSMETNFGVIRLSKEYFPRLYHENFHARFNRSFDINETYLIQVDIKSKRWIDKITDYMNNMDYFFDESNNRKIEIYSLSIDSKGQTIRTPLLQKKLNSKIFYQFTKECFQNDIEVVFDKKLNQCHGSHFAKELALDMDIAKLKFNCERIVKIENLRERTQFEWPQAGYEVYHQKLNLINSKLDLNKPTEPKITLLDYEALQRRLEEKASDKMEQHRRDFENSFLSKFTVKIKSILTKSKCDFEAVVSENIPDLNKILKSLYEINIEADSTRMNLEQEIFSADLFFYQSKCELREKLEHTIENLLEAYRGLRRGLNDAQLIMTNLCLRSLYVKLVTNLSSQTQLEIDQELTQTMDLYKDLKSQKIFSPATKVREMMFLKEINRSTSFVNKQKKELFNALESLVKLSEPINQTQLSGLEEIFSQISDVSSSFVTVKDEEETLVSSKNHFNVDFGTFCHNDELTHFIYLKNDTTSNLSIVLDKGENFYEIFKINDMEFTEIESEQEIVLRLLVKKLNKLIGEYDSTFTICLSRDDGIEEKIYFKLKAQVALINLEVSEESIDFGNVLACNEISTQKELTLSNKTNHLMTLSATVQTQQFILSESLFKLEPKKSEKLVVALKSGKNLGKIEEDLFFKWRSNGYDNSRTVKIKANLQQPKIMVLDQNGLEIKNNQLIYITNTHQQFYYLKLQNKSSIDAKIRVNSSTDTYYDDCKIVDLVSLKPNSFKHLKV